jgi:hypothetical protein
MHSYAQGGTRDEEHPEFHQAAGWSHVKGFLYTGLVAAILCAVVLFVMAPGHQVTLDTSAAFALVTTLLAGALGAAVALIYHLSHLDSLHHAVQHLSELRAGQRDRQSPTR